MTSLQRAESSGYITCFARIQNEAPTELRNSMYWSRRTSGGSIRACDCAEGNRGHSGGAQAGRGFGSSFSDRGARNRGEVARLGDTGS